VSKTTSFYWFDYETFGTSPLWDRPCQFAGIRTDIELNVIGDPLVIYCRQSDDYLPQPGACKVTGITPQLANQKGLCEADFIARIRQELAYNGTCAVGYNNIRFDDEFTRHTLFRNLHDAYEHEWRDGCSRWDLLDVVRMTRALRPEGLNWPVTDDGVATNKLEHLSVANGIEHSQAHDAMSDVWATLGMARLIKQQQPKLFDYAFDNRGKQAVAAMLNTRERTPCFQVSSMIPGTRHHISAVLPLRQIPDNPNSIIVLDLDQDSSYLANLDSDEIARRLFTPARDVTDLGSQPRPGLRTVQINKCPVLVPVSVVRKEDAERLNIDKQAILERADRSSQWLSDSVLGQIEKAMKRDWPENDKVDVDGSLYRGKFLSQHDKQRLASIREAEPESIPQLQGHFDDPRLDEIVWRYRARNFPDSLTSDEQVIWQEHCEQRLNDSTAPWLSFAEFATSLSEIADTDDAVDRTSLWASLRSYGESLRGHTADSWEAIRE